jgi:hypothetical protein
MHVLNGKQVLRKQNTRLLLAPTAQTKPRADAIPFQQYMPINEMEISQADLKNEDSPVSPCHNIYR